MVEEDNKNDYNIMNAVKEDDSPPGSYKISLRSVTKKEFRIDYWTGSFLMACLAYLAISGILLFYYFQQGNPYGSTQQIIDSVYFGHLILTSHLYTAYAMVIIVYVHMFRNYFVGAYKGRFRWLQWMLGVILFILVYVEAVLGYLLSETYIGVSALHVMELLVEKSVIGRLIPALSNWIIALLIGNATTASTVGHLLALHVAIIGGLIVVIAFLHFFLFEKSGPFNLSDRNDEKAVKKDEKHYPWYILAIGFITSV